MKIRSIAAALLLCAACVDEGSDSDQVDETAVEPDKGQESTEEIVERSNEVWSSQDTCDIVADPDDPEGPCAHACNPDELKSFVPEGSCVTFRCTTSDGTPVKVGACND